MTALPKAPESEGVVCWCIGIPILRGKEMGGRGGIRTCVSGYEKPSNITITLRGHRHVLH